jgi:O-antigen/teichoic acid export membrane protein
LAEDAGLIGLFRKARTRALAVLHDKHVGKILRTASVILTGNVASSAFGFLSFAVVARSLGADMLGYFALAQAYVLIVNDLLNVQTWESLIKFGANKGGAQDLSRVVKTNVLIEICSALFAFTFAFTMIGVIGRLLGWDALLIDLARQYCFIIPVTLSTLTIGVPRLFDKFATVAKIQFASAVVKFIIVLYVQHQGGDVKQFLLAFLAAEVLAAVSLIVYSLGLVRREKGLDWFRSPFRLTRDEMRFLWWTNLRTVVRVPVRQLDVLIMNQFLTMNAVGVYKTYKEIVGVIGRVGDTLNQALYPEKLIGRNKVGDSLTVTRKISTVLLSASIAALVGYLAVSHVMISRFFGEEYLAHMPAYYSLVVLNCINLYLTPLNSLFIAAGFARYSFYVVLCNNILYLVVAVVGGKILGIYGLVLAFAVQMIFNQGLKIYLLKKHSTGWSTVIR